MSDYHIIVLVIKFISSKLCTSYFYYVLVIIILNACLLIDQPNVFKQVKAKALISAEMKSIYQKRIDEDERLKLEVEQVFKEIQRYISFTHRTCSLIIISKLLANR